MVGMLAVNLRSAKEMAQSGLCGVVERGEKNSTFETIPVIAEILDVEILCRHCGTFLK